MGEDIAPAQARQHFRAPGRRLVDMRHQRQAGLVGGLQRKIDRRYAAAAAGMLAGTDLDADDDVGVLTHRRDHLARFAQPEIAALADRHLLREAEDAGKGNVDIGQDAHLRTLHDVAAEAKEIAGACAARIDEGGGAALGGKPVGIDAERGAAPIDVAVQVDQAWRDDAPRCIDDLIGAVRRDVGGERRDTAIGDGDIAWRVEPGCRIDQPSALQQEVELHWENLHFFRAFCQTGR